MTPEEMRDHINAAPEPCVGPKLWDQYEGDEGYEMAARSLARALLTVATEDPQLLDVGEEAEDTSGFEAAYNDKLWDATKQRFEGLAEWLGGPTGFQYGWAHNAVRYALGFDPVGNPAVVNIGSNDED